MGDGEDFVHSREMFPILTNAPPSQIRREKIEHKVRRYHLCLHNRFDLSSGNRLLYKSWGSITHSELGDRTCKY